MSTFRHLLDDQWERGQLRQLEADLEEFVRKNADEIRLGLQRRDSTIVRVAGRMKEEGKITDRQMVDLVVRALLRRRGTVNPRRDLEAQLDQIGKEIWYEGERLKGPVSHQRQEEIARSWAGLHAAKWREWHVMELLYTWEKKAPHFLKLLLGTGNTKTRRRTKPEEEIKDRR